MPFLSTVLSIVAVGALATYEYLEHSKKIEEAKQKIEEVQRVEDATKKIFLKKAAQSRIKDDENTSTTILSLSDLAVQDGTLTAKDFKLLKKLQNAAMKLPTNIENPSCKDFSNTGKISYDECVYITKKDIKYYKQSVTGELVNEKSVIKDKSLSEDVAIWSKNKNKRYFKKDFSDNDKKAKIIKKTKDPSVALLILKTEENDAEASLAKKKLHRVLEKVAENFDSDKKDKILSLLNRKKKDFIKFKEEFKSKERERRRKLLLVQMNAIMKYYQNKINYAFILKKLKYQQYIKYNKEIDRKVALLDKKIISLTELINKSRDKQANKNDTGMFSNFTFGFSSFVAKISDFTLEKKKLKMYKEQRDRLLAKKKYISSFDESKKVSAISKLKNCYETQKSKALPNLQEFKSCSSKILLEI